MQWAQFEQVIAFKNREGKSVGFHTRNLQVAHLSDLVWAAVQAPENAAPGVRARLASWNEEVDPAARDANLPQKIRSFSVNVSQICNLKCTYCAADGDGTYGDPIKKADLEIIQDQIRMLLHDVPKGEEFAIVFFGGEPLIVPEAIRSLARFARLQAAGREIDLRFTVVTNGTLVTDEIAEMLASIQANVIVSLDGPPEVNDAHRPTRGGIGSTALVVRGLEKLMRVRDRLGSISAGTVFGSHHTGVMATYEFLKTFDFDSIKIDFAAEDGDAEASHKFTEELLATAEVAYREGGEAELRRLSVFDVYFRALDQQRRIHNHCGAGKSHLQSDARGKISVCQWFVNDPSEEVGSGTDLDHEKISIYSKSLIELNSVGASADYDCRTCWARHLCGGGCMYVNKTKTGSKHRVDVEYCKRTRNTIAKAIEIYAEARSQHH